MHQCNDVYPAGFKPIDNAIRVLEYFPDVVAVVLWDPSPCAWGRGDCQRALENTFDHASRGGWIIFGNVILYTPQARFRTRCPV
jgi:hypothetical protein